MHTSRDIESAEIGRREFLAIFGGVLAELAVCASPAVWRRDDTYLNRRLGIGFVRPSGWDYVRCADMGEMQRGQLLNVDTPDESAELLSSVDLPFVALSPSRFVCGGETAAIQVYSAAPPTTEDLVSVLLREAFPEKARVSVEAKFSPVMQLVRRDWQVSRSLLHKFRVCKLPVNSVLSHWPAAEYTAIYDFRHRELARPCKLRVRTIFVEHRTRFYLLRLIDTRETPIDFDAFLASVRLA